MGVFSRIRGAARLGAALCVMALGTSGAPGQAAQTTLVMPAGPLLPSGFGTWVKEPRQSGAVVGTIDRDKPESLVLGEDGLIRSERATYHWNQNPSATLDVTAFQFEDATGAYSAFTYYRAPEMKGSPSGRKIGNETASNGGRELLILTGTTVVRVSASNVRSPMVDELKQLAYMMPKVGGPKGLSPLLPTYLPEKGLQGDSVRYALGPVSYREMKGVLPAEIIGFTKAAEVVTAKYSNKGTLTLLLFPTPQIAGDHGRAIEAEMNREGGSAGTVKLRREGPLVLLATGAWKADEAQAMVEGIHLRNELTWNKPMPLQFNTEVRKTASLLTSIAVFCGVGALAAVILGLFLGGGRAAIRILQGKPAASEPEFLRIDLSGRVAPIHAEGSGAESS